MPSGFSRAIAICWATRTTVKPSDSNALMTRACGRQSGTSASDGHSGLGDERLEHRRVALKNLLAECLDVEADRRPDVGEGLLVGVALADDDALESQG